MGDSSECFSASAAHLSLPTDIEYMDNVDSEEDEAIKKPTYCSGKSTYINGDSSRGDVRIQIEDLDAPVPIPDPDASGSETNGVEDNCLAEPKISPSEALGRKANGFDEAAELEGSEEEVRTGSPTSSSWAEDNISEDDSNPSLDRDIRGSRTTLMISSNSSNSGIPYKPLHNDDDYDKPNVFPPNGSSNVHRELYSGRHIEMKELIGWGENTSLKNYSAMRDGDKPLRTIDTYQASASSSRRQPTKGEIDEPVSFNLHKSAQNFGLSRQTTTPRTDIRGDYSSVAGLGSSHKFSSNPRIPLHSSCSPSVSGSSVRTILPYETKTPPLGNPLDEAKLRQSAVGLLPARGFASETPHGMPRGEPIHFDDNELDGNEVEGAKKKKKKKKRSGNKSGDLVDAEKKQGKSLPPSGVSTLDKAVTDTVQESSAQQYPPQGDVGSSLMTSTHSTKLKQAGKSKKRTEIKSYSAKEIDGNRGNEDIDSLLHFVEGKKPLTSKGKGTNAAAASNEPKKKQKKQKLVTRLVANSTFEQGKSTSFVMASVVDEMTESTEGIKLCAPSPAVSASGSGLASIESVGDESLASPKVDGSGDQSVSVETLESAASSDKIKQSEANSTSEPVTKTDSKKPVNDVESKDSSNLCRTESSHTATTASAIVNVTTTATVTINTVPTTITTTSTVSDLEFTNFEGLMDQYTEQPFEKYVGRKKKQRQQQPQHSTQQFRQGYATNASFGQPHGRWPATNQPNNTHLNSVNRVHGNGPSHASQTPHGQVGANNHKLPANQSVSRYPSTSSFQSFAAKASSSSRAPQSMAHDQQRKSVGQASSPRSPPSTASPAVKSPPPPREEFPPLRPSTDAQTLKKEISPSTSVTTTSSLVPNKNSNSISSSGAPAVASSGGQLSEPKPVDRRHVRATPSGNNCKYFDRVDIIKIQQYIEMIYPKQNETCYFYSETAKHYHFLKMSAKNN